MSRNTGKHRQLTAKSVTEEPHKHHHYVSLLLHLAYSQPEGAAEVEDETDAQTGEKRKAEVDDTECGREILEDLGRSFRNAVEAREWLSARLLLQFLSLLVPAGLIHPQSILEVYKGLLSVLNEVGGGGDRSERAVRAVGEGLIRSAGSLAPAFPEDVEALIGSIEMFVLGRKGDRALSNPLAPILKAGEEPVPYADTLSELLTALYALRTSDYVPPEVLPRPAEEAPSKFPEGAVLPDPYSLSSVYMPPEMYDPDEENPQECEGRIGGLRLFAEDIVPVPDTVDGWTLRSLVLDMVCIYEVNRKDAARILLSLSRYVAPGTFKSEGSESTYSVESLIVGTILSTLFTLPNTPQKPIYYGSVVTELCKLSPNTVAPPVGRAVRKVFTHLGQDGLDVEIARRCADWFSAHLSNFGFQWMWKEWIPDLELPAAHPRRAFMRRVVDLEIRLAYHDRILQTLPDPMLEKGANVVSDDAPDPVWVYEDATHSLHAEANELHRMLKQKVSSDQVKDYLDNLPGARSAPGEPMSVPVLMMATETIQHLGSRSFSHFLNATERYLDVLRHLSPDFASRRVILDAVQSFWRRSSQMRVTTVDKYLQYGILEPLDVVDFIFSEDSASAGDDAPDGWTDGDKWEMLRMTIDKVVGRVVAVRRRLRAVDKADEVARARRAAERLERGEGVGMDDAEVDDEDSGNDRSRESRNAQASLDLQTNRLEKVFIALVRRFAAELLPWAYGSHEEGEEAVGGLKAVLQLLDSDEVAGWPMRARWGWWREFVRRYAAHLEPLADSIEHSVFSKPVTEGEGPEARAETMVRRVWADALGRE